MVDWDRIVEKLLYDNNHDKTIDDDRISVTETLNCLRRSLYERVYGRSYTTGDVVMIVGRILHEMIEDVVGREEGVYTEVVTTEEVDDEYGRFTIVGRIDVVETSTNTIYEIKTTTSHVRDPQWKHVQQLLFYMRSFSMGEGGVTGELVYLKYTPPVRITRFHYDYDERLVEKNYNNIVKRARTLYRELVRLRDAVRSGESITEAVSRTRVRPETGAWCATCPFRDICLRSNNKPLTFFTLPSRV